MTENFPKALKNMKSHVKEIHKKTSRISIQRNQSLINHLDKAYLKCWELKTEKLLKGARGKEHIKYRERYVHIYKLHWTSQEFTSEILNPDYEVMCLKCQKKKKST